MGICTAQGQTLMLEANKSNLNFRLMQISNAKMQMQNLSNEKITKIYNAQEYENECIELAFEAETEGLDISSNEYTIAYQKYLELKEDINNKYEKMMNEAQAEYERKEAAMDLEQEQIETQLEATDANLESYQGLLENNVKDEFSYFN